MADIERLQLLIGREEIAAINEWRRRQDDPPNKSEAVRTLLKLGLEAWKASQQEGR